MTQLTDNRPTFINNCPLIDRPLTVHVTSPKAKSKYPPPAGGSGLEHVGGAGANPASPAHPRRAPPLRIPDGMPGFDGRRGGVRHGWGRSASASPGLERAPPRLIPRGGRRGCPPLFVVASLVIPTGASDLNSLAFGPAGAVPLIVRDTWSTHSAWRLRR